MQGGNSWGAGGWHSPPNLWPTTLFSGFSHTTDRKVPSEVVLMGSFMSVMSNKTAIFTPHAQRERGKVIGRGVHIYIYIYIYVCLWSKKKFESYFRDRLTFSNVDSRTSR